MKSQFINILRTTSLVVLISFSSCKKYLDAKPNQTLSTPSSLIDLQTILDNYGNLNVALKFTNNFTDEYYLNYDYWNGRDQEDKDSYIWAPEIYIPQGGTDDWNIQYRAIFYANTVLDNLKKIKPEVQLAKWNHVKGQALFFRSYSFFELLQLYAPQYDPNTASTDLGSVLRLNSDFNESSFRSSVMQTYNQIIQDLQEAAILLPENLLPIGDENKTSPGKPATFALMARVYLQMGDYFKAQLYSDSCLQLYNTLLDYNSYSSTPSSVAPFPRFNDEVIFYTATSNALNSRSSSSKVDSILFESYNIMDLRKKLFFTNNGQFKGSYNKSLTNLFNGIATDELYLIRAESFARNGNLTEAMNNLNNLLHKRWIGGTFIPDTVTNVEEALDKILLERKKELLNRGRRWSDLKRLNKEPRYAITLTRDLNGQVYILQPNDYRYSMLIPKQVIEMTGIQQNLR